MSERFVLPTLPKSGLAQPGEFVRLIPELGSNIKPAFVQLGQAEVLTKYVFGKTAVDGYSFGAIAAAADKTAQTIADLQPNRDHIYQTRFGILGPCHFYLHIPSTRTIGGLDNRSALGSGYRELGYFDQHIAPVYRMSPLTERFYTYDYYPAFAIYNPTQTPQTPELVFKGMMFEYQEVLDETILSALSRNNLPYRVANLSGIEHRSPS